MGKTQPNVSTVLAPVVGMRAALRCVGALDAAGMLPADDMAKHAPDMARCLRDLCEWAERVGGWDAPAWERARALLRRVDGVPEPAETA